MNISYQKIKTTIPENVTLIVVSKTKSIADIKEIYDLGQRYFGENKVQELCEKWEALPKDISWHMIGHLQSNKVKYIAPFVHLIHGVDNLDLLTEINKQAKKNNRIIDCLLQIKIATEETKFGMTKTDALAVIDVSKNLKNIKLIGIMGMATFTNNAEIIASEFKVLREVGFELNVLNSEIKTISMGMSADYQLAIASGSTMVRIGSAIFGER